MNVLNSRCTCPENICKSSFWGCWERNAGVVATCLGANSSSGLSMRAKTFREGQLHFQGSTHRLELPESAGSSRDALRVESPKDEVGVPESSWGTLRVESLQDEVRWEWLSLARYLQGRESSGQVAVEVTLRERWWKIPLDVLPS